MSPSAASLESICFATDRQREIAERVTSELIADPAVEAVAFTASVGLGYADPESDLDLSVLARPEHVEHVRGLCEKINEQLNREEDFWVDLDATSGDFKPGAMGWCDLDRFELEVGNLIAYAAPVFDRSGMFGEVRSRWTPYYDEGLAQTRQERFRKLSMNHCVQGMKSVRRDFALDALDRLYLGVQTFVAGLFVARRVYPVDYLKRVDRHLASLLGEPALGNELRSLFDFGALDPDRLENSFTRLDELARTRF